MDLPLEHLKTFASIVDAGSLEAAAKLLHVSPSAISQRLRSMEERTGAVLLRRTRPVTVTDAGAPVLRAARQLAQIVEDVAAEFDQRTERGSLVRLVINADSLATWFVPALARAGAETGARFEVLRADETISTEKLRSGEVTAALTATSEPVPGCVSTLLGVDQYHAVAAPAFYREHFPGGVTAAALMAAPMVEFDRYDMFQQRFIAEFVRADTGADVARDASPPRNFIPSSAEFALAVELGMGWGMLPRLQCADALRRGALVEVLPGRSLPLPLYWQRWNLRSPVLDALSAIVAEEAERALSAGSVEYVSAV